MFILIKFISMSIPLSSIIAGTMNWGVWGKHFNTREMEQLILQYLEEGVTTLIMQIFMVGILLRLVLAKLGAL